MAEPRACPTPGSWCLGGCGVPHPTRSLCTPTISELVGHIHPSAARVAQPMASSGQELTATESDVWLPRGAGTGVVCRRPLLGSIGVVGGGPGPRRGAVSRRHRTVEPGKALLQDPACAGDPFWGRSGWWQGARPAERRRAMSAPDGRAWKGSPTGPGVCRRPLLGSIGVVGGGQPHGEASCRIGTGRSSLERLSYRGMLGVGAVV